MSTLMTADWLRRCNPTCKNQLAIFEGEWPDGAPLTEANLKRAAELGLDLDWIAECYLAPRVYAEYQRIRDEACEWVERVIDQVWVKYRSIDNPQAKKLAQVEYDSIKSQTYAEYELTMIGTLCQLASEE